METTLAYLGKLRFALDERGLGLLLVLVGAVVIAVQGGLIGRLSAALGDRRTALGGAALMAAALAALPLCSSWGQAAAALVVLAAGRALTAPTLAALLSRLGPVGVMGATLGLAQSVAAAARAVGPLVAGWLYDAAPARPYLLAALLAVVAAALLAGSGEAARGRAG